MSDLPKKAYGELLREEARKNWGTYTNKPLLNFRQQSWRCSRARLDGEGDRPRSGWCRGQAAQLFRHAPASRATAPRELGEDLGELPGERALSFPKQNRGPAR